MATPAKYTEIKQFLRNHFLTAERMNVLLGWCEESACDHDRIAQVALGHNLSFYVTERGKPEIVAINIILDSRLENPESIDILSPNTLKILGLVEKLDSASKVNYLHANQGYDFNAEILWVAVDSKFGGQGMATEIFSRTLRFLQAKGFPIIKSSFSSSATRRIEDKLGFQEIGRLSFKEHVDADGEKVFPGATDEDFIVEAVRVFFSSTRFKNLY